MNEKILFLAQTVLAGIIGFGFGILTESPYKRGLAVTGVVIVIAIDIYRQYLIRRETEREMKTISDLLAGHVYQVIGWNEFDGINYALLLTMQQTPNGLHRNGDPVEAYDLGRHARPGSGKMLYCLEKNGIKSLLPC